MPDPGDKLDRAYRDLAREEPSAALDAAILAASRRAVRAGPEAAPRRGFAARYGAPISVAAVLVLGIAVALRMQVEQPGIETSMPAREAPAATPKSIEPPPAQPVAKPEPDRMAPPACSEPPKARAKVAAPMQSPPIAPAEEKREVAPPAPVPQYAPAPAPMPQSFNAAPAAASVAPAAPAPAVAAPAAPAARMAAPMMKRSATADTAAGATAESFAITPEAELERIARLRADSRDDEADRALEAFRKRYPDYRIAEAMWERVRRK